MSAPKRTKGRPFAPGHLKMGGKQRGYKFPATLAREAAHARVIHKAEITAERTMQQIAAVAFSDVGLLFDEQGHLLPLQDVPPVVRAAIANVKTLKTNLVSGDGAQETTREIRLWDKVRALEILAKHFGIVADKPEGSLQVEIIARLERGRQRTAARLNSGPVIDLPPAEE